MSTINSGGSNSKESACNEGDPGSIPGSGRSPGEENGKPFQYSCLGNLMDRGAWWTRVHGVAKSQTRLSDSFTFHQFITKNIIKDTEGQPGEEMNRARS